MIEAAKVWVTKLTVSRPDTSERERAHDLLEGYFAELRQAELVPNFLALTEQASSRQQRILASIVAPRLHPGDAWLALLKEHRHKHCQRLARNCIKLWSEQLVSGALIQGIEKAIHDQDEARIHWLMHLTLEVAREPNTVSLRAVERMLFQKTEAQRRKRRSPSLVDLRVKAFHSGLVEVIAPGDMPLAATAPRTDKELPLPADAAPLTAEELPLPAEGASSLSKPGFWQRLFSRFRR